MVCVLFSKDTYQTLVKTKRGEEYKCFSISKWKIIATKMIVLGPSYLLVSVKMESC